MALVYRIRCKLTGTFSTGGVTPGWSKKGKMWTGKGPLSNHLGLVHPGVYKNADIVAYELVEQEIGVESMQEFLDAKAQRKAAREAADKAQIEAWRKEQRHREYLKLQAEFGQS